MTLAAIENLLNLYVKKIKKGEITIEAVPVKWQEDVRLKLEENK